VRKVSDVNGQLLFQGDLEDLEILRGLKNNNLIQTEQEYLIEEYGPTMKVVTNGIDEVAIIHD
jgi:hypothetical protein